jgi:hypothetical protein
MAYALARTAKAPTHGHTQLIFVALVHARRRLSGLLQYYPTLNLEMHKHTIVQLTWAQC